MKNLKYTLTKEQYDSVLGIEDLNNAMYDIQTFLNITDGGVCGIYWSEFDNEDELWKIASEDERREHIKAYLQLEDTYNNLQNN
ncbi:MAG TPA: hypothetical protein VIV55_10255 [Flavobacterium sp.]